MSRLAPTAAITAVSDIVGRARPANLVRGITGLLVFDGLRFCHAVEGAQIEVLTLMEKIREDARHTDIRILHHGPLAGRHFPRFRTGYTPPEQPDALAPLDALEGEEAVAAFLALVPSLDLDP